MTIRADTDDLIAFLNSLVEIDQYAMAELLCIRVPCNRALADHPSVQVAAGGERSGFTFIAPDTFRVGMLGVLNGFCGTIDDGPRKGWGAISAVYDKGKLLRFERSETVKINAAEPDLLSALKSLAADEPWQNAPHELRRAALAAIAKAEGRRSPDTTSQSDGR